MVNPCPENALAGFQHQAVWWISGMGPKRQLDREWLYPPIGASLATVGLDDIGVYISHYQNMVSQYIVTLPIMELCLVNKLRPGM